jgi:hypothetical protein
VCSGMEGKGDVCRLPSPTEKEGEKYATVLSAHPKVPHRAAHHLATHCLRLAGLKV